MFKAIEKAQALTRRLREEFGPPRASRFAALPVIGCCRDHESDFTWFREHRWADMPGAIVSGRLDPFSFSTLEDEVYYAFVPGICLHILQSLSRLYEAQTFADAGIDDWIDALLVRAEKPGRAGVERHLSFAQYRCVKAVLCFHDDCMHEIAGHAPTIEAPGGRLALRRQIERRWDDWSLYRVRDGSSPLKPRDIVARAYDVFARYSPNGELAACPECLPDDVRDQLLATPLGEIAASPLNLYVEALHEPYLELPAVARQFKYFLPRIMELCAGDDWPTPWGEGYHLLVRLYRILSPETAWGMLGPGRRDEEETCLTDFLRAMIDACMKRPGSGDHAAAGLFDYLECELTYGLSKSRIARRVDAYVFHHPGTRALTHIADYAATHIKAETDHVSGSYEPEDLAVAAERLKTALDTRAAHFEPEKRALFETALARLAPSSGFKA